MNNQLPCYLLVLGTIVIEGCATQHTPIKSLAPNPLEWNNCCSQSRNETKPYFWDVECDFYKAVNTGDIAHVKQMAQVHRHLLFTTVFPTTHWPIHTAAQNGNLELVKFLLSQNPALINAEENWIGTPLDFARHYHHWYLYCWLRVHGGKSRTIRHDQALPTTADSHR